MTRKELVERLVASSGVPRSGVVKVLDGTFEVIGAYLDAGQRITLGGIGSFVPKNIKKADGTVERRVRFRPVVKKAATTAQG